MRHRRAIGVAAAALLIAAVLTSSASAGHRQRSAGTPRVLHTVRLATSVPARSLPTAKPAKHPIRVPLLTPQLSAGGGTDSSVQRKQGTAQMPATTVNFDGISGTGYLPPDPNGDVGPNDYVQIVNASFQVWNKDGTPEAGAAHISSLFSDLGGICASVDRGDPIVQYDQLADRWLISQFAFNSGTGGNPVAPFYQCVAVSTSPDPLGTYYLYQFQSMPNFNDYPKFGVWSDAYYMTTAEFSGSSYNVYAGVGAYALDRTNMLAGKPATDVYIHLDDTHHLMLPADVSGATPPPAGAPNYMASFTDGVSSDSLTISQFHVDFATPGNSTLTTAATLTTASFDSNLCNGSPDCIPQQGTTYTLDPLSDRLMYPLAYRNFGDHQTMVLDHTVDSGSDRAGIRWYELRKSSGNWAIYQQGTYAPADSLSRWMGSIGMDQAGDIALGYSASGPSAYPSIRDTGRLASDALGQMTQSEGTIRTGGGAQLSASSRWGDYTSMSVDPNGCTFWYTNEYYPVSHPYVWHTRIAAFAFPTCSTQPAVSIGDVSVTEGNSGTTTANFPVTLGPANSSQTVVTYSTANGTATAPSDYTSVTNGTVSFAPGETSKQVSVTVNGDATFESDENFYVNISNATNAVVADAQGVGTILNDDPSPPALYMNNTSVTEGDTGTSVNAILTVTLNPVNATQEVDVNYATQDVTAKAASGDYVATNGSLVFAPGQSSQTISVEVDGDAFFEANEKFAVNLSSPVNAIIGQSPGIVTIVNDDPGTNCNIVGTDGDDTSTGTPENDVICGLGGNDTISGEGGNDVIDGGPGNDTVTYADATGGVNVNLSTGIAKGADGNDALSNVENIIGSQHGDRLVGDNGVNFITGLGAIDNIDGMGNVDYSVYSDAPSGVSVDLRYGIASGGAGKDRLANIEGLFGSAYNDLLIGNAHTNTIYGGNGADTIYGEGGDDVLFGEAGNDIFFGGTGIDTCVQGTGTGKRTSCEF